MLHAISRSVHLRSISRAELAHSTGIAIRFPKLYIFFIQKQRQVLLPVLAFANTKLSENSQTSLLCDPKTIECSAIFSFSDLWLYMHELVCFENCLKIVALLAFAIQRYTWNKVKPNVEMLSIVCRRWKSEAYISTTKRWKLWVGAALYSQRDYVIGIKGVPNVLMIRPSVILCTLKSIGLHYIYCTVSYNGKGRWDNLPEVLNVHVNEN